MTVGVRVSLHLPLLYWERRAALQRRAMKHGSVHLQSHVTYTRCHVNRAMKHVMVHVVPYLDVTFPGDQQLCWGYN